MRSVEHQEQFAGGLAEVKQIHRCGKAFMAIVTIQLVWGRAWIYMFMVAVVWSCNLLRLEKVLCFSTAVLI